MALYRAIEASSDQAEIRKILARDMGQAFARAMPACYTAIIQEFQGRGIQPVGLSVRTFEGPGHQLPGVNSAYATLPKGEYQSSRGQPTDIEGHTGPGQFDVSGMGHGRQWTRGARHRASAAGRGPDGPLWPRQRPTRHTQLEHRHACRAAVDEPAAPPDGAGQPAGRVRRRAARVGPQCTRRAEQHTQPQRFDEPSPCRHGRPRLQRGAHRPDGREPDPCPSRRADAGLHRQARPHGDRRRRQPVRPDPVGLARAAADGAPDRAAAIAGAAGGAERLDLLLLAAPPGAPLRQPHRVAGAGLRRLFRGPRQTTARPGARAGSGNRRRRFRPGRSLHRQAGRTGSLHRRAKPWRCAADRRRQDAGKQGVRVAGSAALHAAAPGVAGTDVAAGLPARVPVASLEPGAGAGHASRRGRLRTAARATSVPGAIW